MTRAAPQSRMGGVLPLFVFVCFNFRKNLVLHGFLGDKERDLTSKKK